MKKAQWICVSIAVGSIAVFLGFDGPLRVWNWRHRERWISGSPPLEDRWVADPATLAQAKKIVALTIEQTGCLGPCPVYVFRLERGRRAFYEGNENAARKGRYTGARFHFDNFESLAYFAAARLLPLKDDYQTPVTDHSTTILTIEMTDRTKRISNYANAGPNDLAIFCAALDGVESSIEWVPERP